jgi:hypothetical protein
MDDDMTTIPPATALTPARHAASSSAAASDASVTLRARPMK